MTSEAILNKQTEKAFNVTFYVQLKDDNRYKVTTWMPKSQMNNVIVENGIMTFDAEPWLLTSKAVDFAKWMKENGHRDSYSIEIAASQPKSISRVFAYDYQNF